MPKESPPLSSIDYRKQLIFARRLFGTLKTRHSEPLVGPNDLNPGRNERIVNVLRSFSPVLPREVELAGIFYQLPLNLRRKLKSPELRRIIDDSDNLSRAGHEGSVKLLEMLKKGKIHPSAALVHMASAIATLENPNVSEDERLRIGKIAVDVYAPFASSLGLHSVKETLGNLGLMHGYPREYSAICRSIEDGEPVFEQVVLPPLRESIRRAADQMLIHYKFSHRIKQPYSAFMKLHKILGENWREAPNVWNLQDAAAMRIVLHGDDKRCYEFVSRLKNDPDMGVKIDDDYIKNPKPNGYKSIHALVKQKDESRWHELQIRTQTMHIQAEEDNPRQLHSIHKLGQVPLATSKVLNELKLKTEPHLTATWLHGATFREPTGHGKKRRKKR